MTSDDVLAYSACLYLPNNQHSVYVDAGLQLDTQNYVDTLSLLSYGLWKSMYKKTCQDLKLKRHLLVQQL